MIQDDYSFTRLNSNNNESAIVEKETLAVTGDTINHVSGINDNSDKPSTNSNFKSEIQHSPMNKTGSEISKEKESNVCKQARMLLHLFLQYQAKEPQIQPAIYQICNVNLEAMLQCGLSEDIFNKVVEQLLKIAKEISENEKIENFIESVPVQSSREVFFNICSKVFEDDCVNWGRIVTLFYFASRLIVKSLKQKIDNILWAKELLDWVVDFFKLHFLKWIVNQGGWVKILEWVEFSEKMWMTIFVSSVLFGIWAYFRKS